MAEITILTVQQENGDWIQTVTTGEDGDIDRYSPDRIGEMLVRYTQVVTSNTESTENSESSNK